jgi:NhaC family Na+:H+ antiporter
MVGALAGTWLISGVIPTMIFYGLKILNPSYFLVASLLICTIISLATGSSWGTTATIGIALVGIGESLGVSSGMTAGAVLSGAYFGDKMSPMSDTTNLAPVMAGAELFSHIRYMGITTIPTFIITLLIFMFIGMNLDVIGEPDINDKLNAIKQTFYISPWLMIVPAIVIFLIVKKTPALVSLFTGVMVAGFVAATAQSKILINITGAELFNFETAYKGVIQSITVDTFVETSNRELNALFSTGGMKGMLGTVWLIISAMVFGGVMDAIGALSKISKALLSLASSTFGLFASTVASCLALNVTASDQYLAIVVPGKMFKKAYEDKGLAPENLSRTLEDSGTVTSVLVPWNTCGAYQSGVLGVAVEDYFVYAFFNWISPFMTLLVAGISFKIKEK